MSEAPVRKLAAIVSTDVVGYSRLMGTNEAGTLARMKAHRAELWDPEITRHGGRVVGTAGDALLIEFASAVSAVECSLAVQQGMAAREANQPDDNRMLLRVGINIGEVVVDGDDIYGDGVNVAARLQAIAPAGGICLSGKVHDEIEGKVDAAFEDTGPREVKNIARPVQVWRWTAVEVAAGAEGEGELDMPTPKLVSDRPSIAVLAFNNMSGDPEQEYFSDGIAEDIITALSKFRAFHVIARNTSFTYKGQAINIKQVGRELGVRYVLEGSVRKAGNRVRITGQLIEAETGNHVWAERYDRELVDIFDLQDEITSTIASAISPAFEQAELRRIGRKRPENLDSWDLTLQAIQYVGRATPADFVRARELAERAIELDPLNTQALGTLAWSHGWEVAMGYAPDLAAARAAGMKAARRALEIDPSDPVALRSLGGHLALAGQRGEAIETLRQCTVENPNYAQGWMMYGIVLARGGHFDEGVAALERGVALSPKDPFLAVFYSYTSLSAVMVGRHEEGLALARRGLRIHPDLPSGIRDCAVHLTELGRHDEAAAALAKLRRLQPDLTVATVRTGLFGGLQDRADRDDTAQLQETFRRYCDALARAGLPEG